MTHPFGISKSSHLWLSLCPVGVGLQAIYGSGLRPVKAKLLKAVVLSPLGMHPAPPLFYPFGMQKNNIGGGGVKIGVI